MFDAPCDITCASIVALGVVVAPCVLDVFNCTHPSDVHALFFPLCFSLPNFDPTKQDVKESRGFIYWVKWRIFDTTKF